MRQTSSPPAPLPPPSPSPRRTFVARLAGLMAAWPLLGRRASVGFPRLAPNASLIEALGDAVLPAELGPDGTTRAVNEFQQWMDPRPQWLAQLAALDTDARRGGQSFASLSRERRQAIVRTALAGERGESLPSPLAARHVAVALLAHFYESPLATDMCYDAQIGRQQCRPLAAQAQHPIALARRPR
jgi:hypothetical protein